MPQPGERRGLLGVGVPHRTSRAPQNDRRAQIQTPGLGTATKESGTGLRPEVKTGGHTTRHQAPIPPEDAALVSWLWPANGLRTIRRWVALTPRLSLLLLGSSPPDSSTVSAHQDRRAWAPQGPAQAPGSAPNCKVWAAVSRVSTLTPGRPSSFHLRTAAHGHLSSPFIFRKWFFFK